MTHERYYTVSERKKWVKCGVCGKRAAKDLVADHSRTKQVPSYYVKSTALSVKPGDVEKTIAEDRAMGSMASEYLPTGELVFTSRKDHCKYMKDRGLYNQDDYCGTSCDPLPMRKSAASNREPLFDRVMKKYVERHGGSTQVRRRK
jgi:hypothetical protein